MEKALPRQVDTVVVGTGPSALILSYILHGHIPVYDQTSPHPDPLLHQKLQAYNDLLDIDVDHLTEHFTASRLSYSTQALPVNVLLDALIRPHGETGDADNETCIKWQHDPNKNVSHIVVGDTIHSGGQWVDNPVKASWDIGTLSYAGMLSLPGYDFSSFYLDHYGKQLPSYHRPSRRQVADYFAAYPTKTGIASSIFAGTTLSGIRRNGSGFYIASHDISCRNLVLASGIFTSLIAPRPLLQPLLSLPSPYQMSSPDPILVIGSGFSAADVIISTPTDQKILHIYKWTPEKAPSPLRACHQGAYPEYAGVYRKMKLAAISSSKQARGIKRPQTKTRRPSVTANDLNRDWCQTYEGLPNTAIIDVELGQDGKHASITLQRNSETPFKRRISSLAFVVGRRGSLEYLDPDLRHEICPTYNATRGLSSQDLRERANENLEVAENVFIIGSLTGDTLIRFAYGGCTYAAGKLLKGNTAQTQQVQRRASEPQVTSRSAMVRLNKSWQGIGYGSSHGSRTGDSSRTAMKGLDGHEIPQRIISGSKATI